MQPRTTITVDSRGGIVIPAHIRKQLGIDPRTLLIGDVRDGALVLRPAVALPIESYSKERIAQFILNNAIDADDYRRAVEQVRSMGLDPERIDHDRPE